MRVDEKLRIEKCRVDIASEGIQTSVEKYCCKLRPYSRIQFEVALRALRRSCKEKPAPLLFSLAADFLKSNPSSTFASLSCSSPCQTFLAVQYSTGQVRKLRPISRNAPSRGELVADMKAEMAIGEPILQMRSIRLMTALRRDRSYGACCLSIAGETATIVGTQSRSMETRLATLDNLSRIPNARMRRKVASFHWCNFSGRASLDSMGPLVGGTSSCTSFVMMKAQQTQAAMTTTRLIATVVKRVFSRDGA